MAVSEFVDPEEVSVVTEGVFVQGIWPPTFSFAVTFSFLHTGCDPVSLFAEEIEGSEPEAGEDAVPELPIRFFGSPGMEEISSAIVIRDYS
jgi:hypothetical protein